MAKTSGSIDSARLSACVSSVTRVYGRVQTVRTNYKLGGVCQRLSFGSSQNFLRTSGGTVHVRRKRRCRKSCTVGAICRMARRYVSPRTMRTTAANTPCFVRPDRSFVFIYCIPKEKHNKIIKKTYKDDEKKNVKKRDTAAFRGKIRPRIVTELWNWNSRRLDVVVTDLCLGEYDRRRRWRRRWRVVVMYHNIQCDERHCIFALKSLGYTGFVRVDSISTVEHRSTGND